MSDRLLVATDYTSLKEVLDQRRRSLRLSMIEVDGRVGWADGYASKIFAGVRNLGAQSLGELLQCLGVCLIVAELPQAGKTFRVKAIRRDKFLQKRMSDLARRGAVARNASLTAQERIAASRKASMASAAARKKRKLMAIIGAKGGTGRSNNGGRERWWKRRTYPQNNERAGLG
jgi:hypothetical protein